MLRQLGKNRTAVFFIACHENWHYLSRSFSAAEKFNVIGASDPCEGVVPGLEFVYQQIIALRDERRYGTE